MKPKYGIDRCNTWDAITKDGHTMFAEDVVRDFECLQRKILELKKIESEFKRRYPNAHQWTIDNLSAELMQALAEGKEEG